MSALELTIQVLGLAPRVTLGDLHSFFSYCGTVDKIQLKRNKDQSQSALITFRQPFAYQTALLLNDANFAGQAIHIAPATNLACPPSPDKLNNRTKNNEMQTIASKSVAMLKRTKEGIEEKYKLWEKSAMLVEQARSLVCATEEAAGYVGSKMANSDCVSTGANWLSKVLDDASKLVGELDTRKRDKPSFGKHI